MKILKYLFFLLLIAAIGIVVFAATKNGKFQIEESKLINAPSEVIFKNVNNLRNWETWSPWKEKDPDMVLRYAKNTTGKGASYSWTSATLGNGKMTTTSVIPNHEIVQEITIDTPFGESKSNVYWTFEEQDSGETKVSWGITGEQALFEKVYFLFQNETLEEGIVPMYKKGLENLKRVIDTEVAKYNINVDGITDYGGGYYMYITASVQQSAIAQKMAEMFPVVTNYMSANEIPISGMPLTVYKEMNNDLGTAIISTGIPVAERVIVPWNNDVLCGRLPNGKVLKTTLNGNYANLGEAWAKAYEYMGQNGIEATWNSEAFEVYVTDPEVVKNPAEWITHLYIPVK